MKDEGMKGAGSGEEKPKEKELSIRQSLGETAKVISARRWESFVERRIREAQQQGMFEGLKGMGEPLEGIDEVGDENWWIKKKLKEEGLNVLPPILEARLEVERALKEIRTMETEGGVRRRLEEVNRKVRDAHYSVLAGPASGVMEVDIEKVVSEWRRGRAK